MNKLIAKTSWGDICNIGSGMMNGSPKNEADEDVFRKDLCYISDSSFGKREVEAKNPTHSIKHDFGRWNGYAEQDSRRFLWGSASSGATIEATCNEDSSWTLVFQGTDTSKRRESSYLQNFALAIETETLDILSLDDGQAVVELLKWEAQLMSDAGRADLANKYGQFASKLQLSFD